MEITADAVKEWLDKSGRDRFWLATKCDTEKRTVDNWLSSPRGIPIKAAVIIESLMKADRDKIAATEPSLAHLVIKMELDEFEDWCRVALANGQIVTDWAIDAIREAYKREKDSQSGNKSAAA